MTLSDKNSIHISSSSPLAHDIRLQEFSISTVQSYLPLFKTLNYESPIVPWYVLDRDPSPSASILASLCRLDSVSVERDFAKKLVGFINWISEEHEYQERACRQMWCELFELIRNIDPESNSPEMAVALNSLRIAFDKNLPPSLGLREMRREFTELIITRQCDESLHARWLELVKNRDSDRVLYASLIDATRGFFSCPLLPTSESLSMLLEYALTRMQKAVAPESPEYSRIYSLFSKILAQFGYSIDDIKN